MTYRPPLSVAKDPTTQAVHSRSSCPIPWASDELQKLDNDVSIHRKKTGHDEVSDRTSGHVNSVVSQHLSQVTGKKRLHLLEDVGLKGMGKFPWNPFFWQRYNTSVWRSKQMGQLHWMRFHTKNVALKPHVAGIFFNRRKMWEKSRIVQFVDWRHPITNIRYKITPSSPESNFIQLFTVHIVCKYDIQLTGQCVCNANQAESLRWLHYL